MAFEINLEIMMLVLLSAITVLGYMIAINAHGTTRMSFSYLFATLLLAVTGFMIYEYVDDILSVEREQEYLSRLANERAEMEQRMMEQGIAREELQEQELKNDEVLKVQAVVREALDVAEKLSSMNMQDYTLTIDQKIAQAADLKRKVQSLEVRYNGMSGELVYVNNSIIPSAIDKLSKSALYCKLYYTAEDSEQEAVRENVMRTNALAAKRILSDFNNQLERMKS